MKKVNHLTLAALALLSLAGCTHDEEPTANGLPMTGTPLRTTAEITAPVTREAMTTQDLTHYYFRVTDQDGAATTEYDYFTSMKLADGQWTGDKAMTWGTAYPKVSALEQKGVEWNQTEYTTGKTIAVQTDQSDRETGLLKSDLLYMAPKAISAADLDNEGNIKVNLAHRFAKLKVVVNVTGATANPITALTIGGTQTTATFIPETDVLTQSGNVADIIPYRESTEASTSGPGYTITYECILLPQQLAANTLEVTAIMDEGNKSYTHAEALTLNSNYQYTLTLNMAYNETMKPSGDVNVGNWGDEEAGSGDLEEGAEISEDGKTYIVSTATGLLEWAQAVQSNKELNLTLTANIDMTGKAWPAIEDYKGTIEGNWHTISNLELTQIGETDKTTGLIVKAFSCSIKNLTLQKPVINLTTSEEKAVFTGFLIGNYETANAGYVENCHIVNGKILNGGQYNGGLIGSALYYKTVTACSVTSTDATCDYFSGLGHQIVNSTITACYVYGGKWEVHKAGGISYNGAYSTSIACYWQVEGVNRGYVNNDANGTTTQISDDADWSTIASDMNQALSDKDYEWVVNDGTDKETRPLVTAPKTTN